MEPEDAEILHGQVKWFDPGKGFGFVVADSGGSDILLHANVLRNFGQSSVTDGARVEVVVLDTPRGRQAVEVKRIDPPLADYVEGPEGVIDDAGLRAAGPLSAARVKWFDKAKGFGFANAFGRAEDIFIHIEVLRRSGLADLQPGEAVCLRITEGKRGLMAAVVTSWELALREEGDPEDIVVPGQDDPVDAFSKQAGDGDPES